MTKQLTHICESCGKSHPVYPSELKRGRGLFCSLSCARRHAHSKPIPTTCLTCNSTFYTRLNREYCSIECQPEEPREEVDAEPQVDRASELQEKWQVKTGDLWQCGEHRLICSDCTDPAVVERLMQGEKG